MIVDGVKIPFVEVAREFARDPSRYSFNRRERRRGGSMIYGRRINSLDMSIPVYISRRGNEDLSWDDIKLSLGKKLYSDKPSLVSFSHGDGYAYEGYIAGIEFADEHEYVALGVISLVGDKDIRYSGTKSLSVGPSEASIEIEGVDDVDWQLKSVLESDASSFTFEVAGVEVILNHGFKVGDVLEINYDNRSIRLNSDDLTTVLDIRSRWGELPVGISRAKASQSSLIYYREKYF